MRRITPLFCLLLFVVAAPAFAQIEIMRGEEVVQLPMPGQGRQMSTGTGQIRGRIVSAETGAPIRRAQVRLSGPDILPKATTTDGQGAYGFRDLPAGRFTLHASKSGYVSVGFGQTRPFESGKPIELTEAQVVEKVDIVMPKGSVIAGRIVDEFGEPVADAAVSAMRSSWSNGRRRLQPTGRTATTNDLGQYRIYGLPPGDYFVSATLRDTQERMVSEMAVVAFGPAGSTGGGGDAPRTGYAPTYYPGTPNGNEAQKLTVAVGQEAQNTDFALVAVRLAKITGTVVGSDGQPANGVMVSALPAAPAAGAPVMLGVSSTRTEGNGQFTLTGVPPGDYTLSARSAGTMMTSGDGERTVLTVMTRGVGAGADSQPESGSIPLSVSGDDMPNVMIVTTKGTSASGRVVWEGGSAPSVNTLRINATSAGMDMAGPMGLMGGSSSVSPDGIFEIKGLSGRRIFRVSNVPAGWVLRAVRLNGTDITDHGVDVRPSEPLTGLEVVLTSRTTDVTGGVKAGSGPATDYTVVIFSEDPEKWTAPMPRHIASARPNQQGRFQVRNLPAGSYYAIALEYIPQGDWNDPEVLDRLKTRASRFTLGEGDSQILDLTLEGS